MKGKIDQYGYLSIERAGILRLQYCDTGPKENECGDHCPLFGEVEVDSGGGIVPSGLSLRICQDRILYFDKFADERPTP